MRRRARATAAAARQGGYDGVALHAAARPLIACSSGHSHIRDVALILGEQLAEVDASRCQRSIGLGTCEQHAGASIVMLAAAWVLPFRRAACVRLLALAVAATALRAALPAS